MVSLAWLDVCVEACVVHRAKEESMMWWGDAGDLSKSEGTSAVAELLTHMSLKEPSGSIGEGYR